MKNNKNQIIKLILYILIALVVIFATVSCISDWTRLTYIEHDLSNDLSTEYVVLDKQGDSVSQVFVANYDIMHGIALRFGTNSRDNNSDWNLSIIENNTDKVMYNQKFNANIVKDREYTIFDFDNNISLKKGEKYRIVITAERVSEDTSLALFVKYSGDNNNYIHNDISSQGMIVYNIYGGDRDIWWIVKDLIVALFIFILLYRILLDISKEKVLIEDNITVAMILSLVVFLFLLFSLKGPSFTDEYDNIRGGLIIRKGGVLYRDYITQHTPLTYYICSFFAFLGAKSVEQFRLLFNVTIALIWGFIYLRHYKIIGKSKMILLPVLECLLVQLLVPQQGYQVLSETVEGICLVALVLEFIRYKKIKEIKIKDSIFISIFIWGAFGSIFLSAYSILWIVVAVVISEIVIITKKGINLIDLIKRYATLLFSVIVPPTIAIIYFASNGALYHAYKQAYLFNREIYPIYLGGLGSNLFQPITDSINNFLNLIKSSIDVLLSGKATGSTIVQILLIFLILLSLYISLVHKKNRMINITLLLSMCCAAPRGYSFHGLAAWYLSVAVIIFNLDTIEEILNQKWAKIVISTICVYVICLFGTNYISSIQIKQSYVSEMETNIVQITDEGEGILLDAYSLDSIYLLYKNRYPVNSLVYFLPWYMDWFEQDLIQELYTKNPRIAIYDQEENAWEQMYYCSAFKNCLEEKYTQFSDNPDAGYPYSIWIRNY